MLPPKNAFCPPQTLKPGYGLAAGCIFLYS